MSQPFLFISHVSEDRSPAADLVTELERRGVQCWIAPRNVRPGKPYDDEIAEAIDDCTAMLLIFSEHCNKSEYIRREITVAGEAHKLVIPFRIEDAKPKGGLRVRLADLHWIDGFIAREQAVDAIVRSVSKDTGAWRGNYRAGGADTAVAAAPAVAPATVREPATTPTQPAALSDNEPAPAPAPAPTTSTEDELPASLQEHLRNADAGDPESLYIVGLFQCNGGYRGRLSASPSKALEALRRSAAQGHAGAQHKIGWLYRFGPEYGIEPKKDIRRAAEWLGKAAEQGHRGALCDLARLYEQGDGVEPDREKALALYREAVERGAFWAGRNVARLTGALADTQASREEMEIPTLSESDMAALRQVEAWPFSRQFPIPRWDLDDLVRRAAAGEAQAQYVIGHKLDLARTYESALRWVRLSAAQGFPPAQCMLGHFYQNGKGVDPDRPEAAGWFERAASAAVPDALYHLGRLYKEGWGVPKDSAKALLLMEEARAQGYAYLTQRSIDHLTPIVAATTADAAKTSEPEPAPAPAASTEDKLAPWIKAHLRGVEAGNAEDQYVVGVMHRYGNGLPADSTKAVALLRQAEAQGHAGARRQFGLMFRDGHIFSKDAQKAAEWFAKASAQGHPGALCDLAGLHELGEGVEPDSKKALALYEEAVAHGAFWAAWHVRRLNGAEDDLATPMPAAEAESLLKGDISLSPFEGLEQLVLGITFSPIGGLTVFTDKLDDVIRRAKDGDAKAQYAVGYKYSMAKDIAAAHSWYRLSAAQRFGPAIYKIGLHYRNGEGVERDGRRAVLWFERAVAEGYRSAFFDLGWLYEHGDVVEQNKARALLLYEEGVARGAALGQDAADRLKQEMAAEASLASA